MASELLQLAGVSAGYGNIQILWDIDLSIEVGEYVAILGSNGAGKSTLLKVIAGLIHPRRGDVFFDGKKITPLDTQGRVGLGVSLVPEGRRLFTGMSVKENLLMGAFVRPNSGEVAQDLEWVLGLFPDLQEKLSQVAGTLSGGEQQMCSIGRSLMARPRLLLIDELSFGLAPTLVERLLEAVKGINRDGTTVVLVEQDVMSALRYAARGYVMNGGRLVKDGTSAGLLADPLIQKSYLGI
jgi:branched-chain amino acid transport system ATP-binding protein